MHLHPEQMPLLPEQMHLHPEQIQMPLHTAYSLGFTFPVMRLSQKLQTATGEIGPSTAVQLPKRYIEQNIQRLSPSGCSR